MRMVAVGLRVGHHLQLREGLFHFGWVSAGRWSSGSEQEANPLRHLQTGPTAGGWNGEWGNTLHSDDFDCFKDEIQQGIVDDNGLGWSGTGICDFMMAAKSFDREKKRSKIFALINSTFKHIMQSILLYIIIR
jgi:hypothetical protein